LTFELALFKIQAQVSSASSNALSSQNSPLTKESSEQLRFNY